MLERSEASNPVILTTERRKDLKTTAKRATEGGDNSRAKKEYSREAWKIYNLYIPCNLLGEFYCSKEKTRILHR